jgi:hypothetical protein
MKLLFIFLAFSLSACSPIGAAKHGQEIGDGNGQATVALTYLEDGTRCAVLIGYSKGAISCDWQKKGGSK